MFLSVPPIQVFSTQHMSSNGTQNLHTFSTGSGKLQIRLSIRGNRSDDAFVKDPSTSPPLVKRKVYSSTSNNACNERFSGFIFKQLTGTCTSANVAGKRCETP